MIYYKIIQKLFNQRIKVNDVTAIAVVFINKLVKSGTESTKELLFEPLCHFPFINALKRHAWRHLRRYYVNKEYWLLCQ